jgi:uncharacterized RDD family membrane protein YckC
MDPGPSPTRSRQVPRWRQYELAGFGTRLAAWLIDGLIVGGIAVGVRVLAGRPAIGSTSPTTRELLISLVAVTAITAAYYVPQMVQRDGRTVGKRVMKIRVVRANEAPMDARTVVLREILCKQLGFGLTLVALAAPDIIVVGLIDYLWVLWDPQYRALHDMAARTRVVNAPR